jgi:hypothetical protein
MEAIVQRLAALECCSVAGGIERDLRVIEMQIARAEEKVLRIDRGSSWTRSGLLTQTMQVL